MFVILFMLCSLSMMYFFYNVLYGKIQLYRVRLKMQDQGFIPVVDNLKINLICNIFFTMFPVRKYREEGNKEHNKLLSKINYSLLGLVLVFVGLGALNILLH